VQTAGGAPGVFKRIADIEPAKTPDLYIPISMGIPTRGDT